MEKTTTTTTEYVFSMSEIADILKEHVGLHKDTTCSIDTDTDWPPTTVTLTVTTHG